MNTPGKLPFAKLILFLVLAFSAVGVKAGEIPLINDPLWTKNLSTSLYNVKFLPGDTTLFVAGGEYIYFLDARTGEVIDKYKNDVEIRASALTKNGDKIIVPAISKHNQKSIKIFDIKTKTFGSAFNGEIFFAGTEKFPYTYADIKLSSDEKYLITTSNGNVAIWDIITGEVIDTISIPLSVHLNAEVLGNTNKVLFNTYYFAGPVGSEYYQTYICSIPDLKLIDSIYGGVGKAMYNDTSFLFIKKTELNDLNKELHLYSIEDFKPLKKYSIDGRIFLYAVAVTPDDKYLLADGLKAGHWRLFDLNNEKDVVEYFLIPRPNDENYSFSSNQGLLAIGNYWLFMFNAHWEPNSVGENSGILSNIIIKPNITSNLLNISFNSTLTNIFTFEIIDLNGNQYYLEKDVYCSEGLNNKSISLTNISNGEYLLRIYCNIFSISEKFIIMR